MIPKFNFIFSLSPCIIPGNAMQTFRVQVKDTQSNFDTSWMSLHISNKPDTKALSLGWGALFTSRSYLHLGELEMKGYTKIEGQSIQGSDK